MAEYQSGSDPDPIRIQGFDYQKFNKIYSLKQIKYFFYQKASIKDVQATEESSSSQKRTSSTNMKFLNFSLFLWVIFVLLDPDPESESGYAQIQSGSETLAWPPPTVFSLTGMFWKISLPRVMARPLSSAMQPATPVIWESIRAGSEVLI